MSAGTPGNTRHVDIDGNGRGRERETLATYDAITARADVIAADESLAVRPGPGKFESNADAVLAESLYAASLDGWADEVTGDVDVWAYFCRIGRFICEETSQGFFDVTDHGTEAQASIIMDGLADEYAAIMDESD